MRTLYFIAICCLAASGCSRNQPEVTAADPAGSQPQSTSMSAAPAVDASVELQPTQGNSAAGTLKLIARTSGVQITGRVTGLTPNAEHGIHIHEKGDCSAPDAESAGEHFAPLQHPHGPPHPESHVGDLGNLQVDAQGVATVDVNAVLATLGTGAATDVKGKAIIVHAKKDDLTSQPSGDSGPRIACGVIS